MSCIVYQTDKKTGVKYAYESISYWDKEKKQPRSKRKYLGRVDPETNEIIPSPRRGTLPANNTPADSQLPDQLQSILAEKEEQILTLKKERDLLKEKCRLMSERLEEIKHLCTTPVE